jgi:hypothetical protein
MKARQIALILACASLVACATPPGKDPLQNTKKLVAEGHATLYNNGAFEIPNTTLHIIPPGPSAVELASELVGLRARQSFQESIQHARESVAFAQAGVDKSTELAQEVHQNTSDLAAQSRGITRFGGELVSRSPALVSVALGASVDYGGAAFRQTKEAGVRLEEGALTTAGEMSVNTRSSSKKILDNTVQLAGSTSAAALASSSKSAAYAAERFVKGYAVLPAKLKRRGQDVVESASLENFVEAYQSTNDWRAAESGKFSDIIVETTSNYGKDIQTSFAEAGREIKGKNQVGSTLALLKSLRWVMQGIFWDATIKPTGKLVGATLGYLSVNAVAYPALITLKEGVAVANVAVQLTWNSAAAVYEVTAPSATAAMVGLFSAVQLVGGQTLAGGELLGGSLIAAGTEGLGQTTAGVIAGGGYLAGKTVQYIAAPLSSVGVAAGVGSVGVVMGSGTAVAGAGVAAVGIATEAVTQVAGNAAAATVLVGGSAASVVAGAALGTYELSKAVVVPAGYGLGSGIVLGYGTLSQLSAQAVLAVADASYMVLSLEGPNWVLYAVKGVVDKGEKLPQGAVLDLKAMQKEGEEFVAVPVKDEELKRLVNVLPEQLTHKSKPDPAQSL